MAADSPAAAQILSLATLTAAYLDRHLSKPSVRTGDWASKTLSDEARTYAVSPSSSPAFGPLTLRLTLSVAPLQACDIL